MTAATRGLCSWYHEKMLSRRYIGDIAKTLKSKTFSKLISKTLR